MSLASFFQGIQITYQNSFFPEVIRGISQIAADHHYLIQLCTGKDDEQRLRILKDTILGRRVDGIIFLYGETDDPLVELAIEQEFPSVVIGKSLSPFISFVDNNNEKAGFDATEYMIQEGCLFIAFVSGRHQLFVSARSFNWLSTCFRTLSYSFQRRFNSLICWRIYKRTWISNNEINYRT